MSSLHTPIHIGSLCADQQVKSKLLDLHEQRESEASRTISALRVQVESMVEAPTLHTLQANLAAREADITNLCAQVRAGSVRSLPLDVHGMVLLQLSASKEAGNMQNQRLAHEIAMNDQLRKKVQLLQDEIHVLQRKTRLSVEPSDTELQLKDAMARLTEVAQSAHLELCGTGQLVSQWQLSLYAICTAWRPQDARLGRTACSSPTADCHLRGTGSKPIRISHLLCAVTNCGGSAPAGPHA